MRFQAVSAVCGNWLPLIKEKVYRASAEQVLLCVVAVLDVINADRDR